MGSTVLNDTIEVATPPEFSGGIPGIWSPEHLFVGAVGSCFMTTFLAVAEKSRLPFDGFCCQASGILENKDEVVMISRISLHPEILVPRQELIGKALKVLDISHAACLILHSVKSEIVMLPKIQCADNIHLKVSNPY